MECCIYILGSKNSQRYYIGSSVNPTGRLSQHNAGSVVATRGKGPWRLLFSQQYSSLIQARRAEKWLKQMKSRRLVEQIVRDGRLKHSV